MDRGKPGEVGGVGGVGGVGEEEEEMFGYDFNDGYSQEDATLVAEGKMRDFQDDLAKKDFERDERQKLKQDRRGPRDRGDGGGAGGAGDGDGQAAPKLFKPVDLRHEGEAAVTIKQPKMLQGTLKEYQLKGLDWLVNLYEQGINGILADEMGLGKTIQAISFLANLAEDKNIWGPFIVVAPASTLHNWHQEIGRFAPGLKTLPYVGR
jgi:DNA helicase INO80